ncbi:hypothetical protein LARI1_G007858 [Lachnellula arida]|uniref:Uncharacterized protein n=1 Tax=Lachnellula arida TaxID=1316785 RepID=A0A8T9B8P3_9HELO|nr:hypothetical protein LARI1_G007858 [Lachnellula arida]
MYAVRLNILLGALLSLAAAEISPRGDNDPAAAYLNQMCSPVYDNAVDSDGPNTNILGSIENSPFPCDQSLYIFFVCTANGTTEIDFLAEQQCICTGSYWEALEACSACRFAHGSSDDSPEEADAPRSSLKTAECSPSPPFQPFSNLMPTINRTAYRLQPNITLTNDKFPSNTAVSNYYTKPVSFTPGSITGSATARLTFFTNSDEVRYTPTSVPPNNGTGTAGSKSSNAAPRDDVKVAGGLLAGLLGVAALL